MVSPGNDPVLVHFVVRHFLNGNDGCAELVVEFYHLRQNAVLTRFNQTQVICEHHREGLSPIRL